MKMFDKADMKDRIGSMQKVNTLEHLKVVEKYFVKKAKEYNIEYEYDVVANELPYFKTIQYTEIGHSFLANPLQQELRCQQFVDAYNDDAEVSGDWIAYFRNRIETKESNKYTHIKHREYEPRPHLILPVGSNKLKDTICLNKLLYIIRKNGEDNVYFKPHPLTTHALVGELKDQLGDGVVLERDSDMYSLLEKAEVVHTSHMSESILYAVALNKKIDPIDVYNKVERGSYYPISKHLFNNPDPQNWINKTFNSPKSGIFNPQVDEDWQGKMDKYFEYIMAERDKHKGQFVYTTGG